MANDPLVVDTENRQDPKALQTKVIYPGDEWDGQPYVAVTESGIALSAGKVNGIAMSTKFGITLGGPISLCAMPDQIAIGGGYWRFNPQLLSCIPSTTPTPVPVLVKSTPALLKAKGTLASAIGGLFSNSDVASFL